MAQNEVPKTFKNLPKVKNKKSSQRSVIEKNYKEKIKHYKNEIKILKREVRRLKKQVEGLQKIKPEKKKKVVKVKVDPREAAIKKFQEMRKQLGKPDETDTKS